MASQKDLDLCERVIGIKIKDNARALGFTHMVGMDGAIALKLGMPPADVDQFIGRSPLAGRVFSTKRRYVPVLTGIAWWDVERVRKFKAAQTVLPNGAYLNLLIDFDSPGQAIVYIFYHEI